MPALINVKPVSATTCSTKLASQRCQSQRDWQIVLEDYSMRRLYLFPSIIVVATFICSVLTASAQTGQLRGHVLLKQADGTTVKAAGAQVDVYRIDLPGSYPTKANKNGDFVYAGLPYTGTYVIAVSMPNAAPTYQPNVKAGREIDYELTLSPGDGRRLTLAEIKKTEAGGAANSSGSTGESATDKAKREEIEKKNTEITAGNKKIDDTNRIVGDSFKAGNTALTAAGEADKTNKREEAIKLYSDALQQYETGLAADPEQPALLTNKAAALKARGVDKYNIAVISKDEATKNSGLESARADFKAAAEAANKAVDLLKNEKSATDPEQQKQQTANKYAALTVRAEAMRLFVTKADPTQADAGIAAYQEYMAAETDPVKKSRAQLDLAKMLLDVGAGDKALAEFQKILAANPDDPDANRGAGLALFSTGDKAKYKEAANYLQRFVDKAPDTHPDKQSAKDALEYLKTSENIVPEKTTTPARRKRP
jgi:tetratricopeptide (TPR) repeat protein